MKKFLSVLLTIISPLICSVAMAVDDVEILELQTDVSTTKSKAEQNAAAIENMKGGLPALEDRVGTIETRLDSDEFTGPEGPQGEPGPQGPPGDCECTELQEQIDALTIRIQSIETELFEGCIDNDQDGFGIGGNCLGQDCDDDNPDIYFGAEEHCDSVDNNCDGVVDEDCICGDLNSCADDGFYCTVEVCDPILGCQHISRPAGTPCDDGDEADDNICNSSCDGTFHCVSNVNAAAGTPCGIGKVCNDGGDCIPAP